MGIPTLPLTGCAIWDKYCIVTLPLHASVSHAMGDSNSGSWGGLPCRFDSVRGVLRVVMVPAAR